MDKTVKLGKDESFQDRDEHGNLLRYVWFADGKTLFNKIVIEFGYALVSPEKHVYQAEFEQAQTWAEEDQKGLWHPDTCGGKLQPVAAQSRDLIDVKKLDINMATLEELQTLPDIGPETAQAIIDGRPYEKVEDLLKVKGIADKKLAEIRDLVVVTTKVNVNTATLEELQTLPGIGPKLGQAIIDGRPYEKVEDLINVKGIGEKKLETLKGLVEVKSLEE